jgi:dephospho-CoA kinase
MASPKGKRVKPVIGIVGGVGAGKSAAAACFAALGCRRIDADKIGHDLLNGESIRRRVRRRWGDGVFLPGGTVNRRALGRLVFDDPAELRILNSILHPAIRREIRRRIAEGRRDPRTKALVLDAAVLFEAGWEEFCTDLVFVKSPRALRAARVKKARGWNRRTWQAREKSQISLDDKKKRCYHSVDNSSGVSHLSSQVRRVFNRIVTTQD